METLRLYLNDLSTEEQSAFVDRCGTSLSYLRKAISTEQRLSVELSMKIERESKGKVRCEDLRPDVDWQYLRTRDNPVAVS